MARTRQNPNQNTGHYVQDKQVSTVTSRAVTFQTGFGFINTGAGGVAFATQALTFPTAFTTVLGVVLTEIGENNAADPTGPTGANSDFKNAVIKAGAITNSGCNVTIGTNTGGNFGSNERWMYSWIAWGVL